MKTAYGGFGHDAFYETFSKLRLIYKQTPQSEGVVFPFSALKNPFCGTFNLAECHGAVKYLRFTTSLKDFFEIKGNNLYMVVILFAPRSLIAQRLDSTAKPLLAVKDNWTEDFGIFWRWGSDNNLGRFDYVVTRSLKDVCSENLLSIWKESASIPREHGRLNVPRCAHPDVFAELRRWCVNQN